MGHPELGSGPYPAGCHVPANPPRLGFPGRAASTGLHSVKGQSQEIKTHGQTHGYVLFLHPSTWGRDDSWVLGLDGPVDPQLAWSWLSPGVLSSLTCCFPSVFRLQPLYPQYPGLLSPRSGSHLLVVYHPKCVGTPVFHSSSCATSPPCLSASPQGLCSVTAGSLPG